MTAAPSGSTNPGVRSNDHHAHPGVAVFQSTDIRYRKGSLGRGLGQCTGYTPPKPVASQGRSGRLPGTRSLSMSSFQSQQKSISSWLKVKVTEGRVSENAEVGGGGAGAGRTNDLGFKAKRENGGKDVMKQP